MYDTLGCGWRNSVVGFVGMVIKIPVPFIFWKHGPRGEAKEQVEVCGWIRGRQIDIVDDCDVMGEDH